MFCKIFKQRLKLKKKLFRKVMKVQLLFDTINLRKKTHKNNKEKTILIFDAVKQLKLEILE